MKQITHKDTLRLIYLELCLRDTKYIKSFDLIKTKIQQIINKYATTNWQHNLIFDKISILNDKQNYYFLSDAIKDINLIINEV